MPEEGDCTFISLTYPVAEEGQFGSKNINRKVRNFIVNVVDYQEDSAEETPEALVENFIKEYQETANEFPEYELPWEANITGKVMYQSADLISIKFNTYMFTGGAHGYRSMDFLNFDAKTGELLEAEDLFTPEFQNYVEQDFRKKQDISEEANINSTGMFFENDEFHLPENIGITKDSIVLHYNAYDIAPYAAGNFILTYPKAGIRKYLKIREEETSGNLKN